jgi:hypothetical protein
MSPSQRAKAAYTMAEAADDPRDKAAFRAAARAWEQLSRPAVTYSNTPAERALAALKARAAEPPGAPKQPLIDELRAAGGRAAHQRARHLQEATIEF